MKHQTHFKGWFIIIIIGFWLLPIFISEESAKTRVLEEIGKVQSQFGEVASNHVVEGANSTFDFMVVRTGLLEWAMRGEVSKEAQTQTERVMGRVVSTGTSFTNRYVRGAIANVYGLFFRLQMLLVWMPLMIPFLIAIVIDGYVARKMKMSSFGYFSPAAFQLANHTLIFMIMLPAAYLVLPFVMSPMWVPFLAIAAGFAMRLAIKHAQRMIG